MRLKEKEQKEKKPQDNPERVEYSIDEIGEMIANRLNNMYEVKFWILDTPPIFEGEIEYEGKKIKAEDLWKEAYFIYAPYDNVKGYILLWTKWFNIGELGRYRFSIEYKEFQTQKDYEKFIKEICDDIIEKLQNYQGFKIRAKWQ